MLTGLRLVTQGLLVCDRVIDLGFEARDLQTSDMQQLTCGSGIFGCRIQIGEDRPFVEYVAEVIKNYGHSVRCGQRFIHQALPRLLTVYFDFGNHMLGLPGPPGAQDRAAQRHVGDAMQRLFKELPLYAWLVVLPQLSSRVCHPHQATQGMVQHILVGVTSSYPQQASGQSSLLSHPCLGVLKAGTRAKDCMGSDSLPSAYHHKTTRSRSADGVQLVLDLQYLLDLRTFGRYDLSNAAKYDM